MSTALEATRTGAVFAFLLGAGIAIVGVGLMILHEYRAAALGADEVLWRVSLPSTAPALDLPGILINSSNVGMSKVAFDVGGERNPSVITPGHWERLARACDVRPQFLGKLVRAVAAALQEIFYITRLRIAARVTGEGMPRVTGRLSTHVLDTHAGRGAYDLGSGAARRR